MSKFNIYCLINNNKKEEAQLLLDLKKELGFEEKFYENKINFLMGYTTLPEDRSFRKYNFRLSLITQDQSPI